MFPVQSSVLSAEALAADVLPHYRLESPIRCRLHSRGVNDVYRVQSGESIAYFRVSPHGWRSAAEVAAELTALDDLPTRASALRRVSAAGTANI